MIRRTATEAVLNEGSMQPFLRIALLAASVTRGLAVAGCGISVSGKAGGSGAGGLSLGGTNSGSGSTASVGASPGSSVASPSSPGSSSSSSSSSGHSSVDMGTIAVCEKFDTLLEQGYNEITIGGDNPEAKYYLPVAQQVSRIALPASGRLAGELARLANDLRAAAKIVASGGEPSISQFNHDNGAISATCLAANGG
jgi:hypothetical protein